MCWQINVWCRSFAFLMHGTVATSEKGKHMNSAVQILSPFHMQE